MRGILKFLNFMVIYNFSIKRVGRCARNLFRISAVLLFLIILVINFLLLFDNAGVKLCQWNLLEITLKFKGIVTSILATDGIFLGLMDIYCGRWVLITM
jgi:hypothetical protein